MYRYMSLPGQRPAPGPQPSPRGHGRKCIFEARLRRGKRAGTTSPAQQNQNDWNSQETVTDAPNIQPFCQFFRSAPRIHRCQVR
jgi:hypothetical protein